MQEQGLKNSRHRLHQHQINQRGQSQFLPLFLRSEQIRALIVGGGRGAWRKLQTLMRAGVQCTILSPELTSSEIQYQVEQGGVDWQASVYSKEFDLGSYSLVVAGTGVSDLDKEICIRAMSQGSLALSLSDPSQGNIEFGAVGSGAGVDIAVHTAYRLPEFAQLLRDRIIALLGEDIETKLRELSAIRANLLSSPEDKELLERYQLIKQDIQDYIQ